MGQPVVREPPRPGDSPNAPFGFRAVLWHQGESDSISKTAAETYAARLISVIADSRADAGFKVPWGIALASNLPGTSPQAEAQVREGQMMVTTQDQRAFVGADTDSFLDQAMTYDRVHFNEAGLAEHGRLWSAAVLAQANWLMPVAADPNCDRQVTSADTTALLARLLGATPTSDAYLLNRCLAGDVLEPCAALPIPPAGVDS